MSNKLQSTQSQSTSRGFWTEKERYSTWLPNNWVGSRGASEAVAGNVSKAVGTSVFSRGKYAPIRTNLLATINFPNLFKGAGLKDYILKVEDKNKVLEDMRRGTVNVGGGREPIICPVEIMGVSARLKDEISEGKGRLEVVREFREFLLQFRQDGEGKENKLEFFYSELNGIPVFIEGNKMKFSFKSPEGVNYIEVKFTSQSQYEQLKKGFERYDKILTYDAKRYDKKMEDNLDDIAYNRGGNEFGDGKFYKKPARQWNSKEIEEWLLSIPFQEQGRGRIFNVHEYMGKYRKYPADEKKTQRDPEEADYTQLSYDKLYEYFEKRAEDDGQLVKKPETYLDRLFENDMELFQTIQFEVKMMECNSPKKNEPYYNYNFNQVLKKMFSHHAQAADPSSLPSLTYLRNELLVEKRYLWSVMDNMDHFLSLLLFKEGVEDFIERKKRQFEGDKIVDFVKRSNDDWYDWASKLHKFNYANHFILEEMDFTIRKEYEFFLTVIVKMTWLKTLMTTKSKLPKDKFLAELVEKEKKENENNPNPTLKYTNPVIHQICLDTLAEIAEKESKLPAAKKKSKKAKKKVILDLWKPLNKHKKMLSMKAKKQEAEGAVEEDEEAKRKRFQEENEFLISARRRRIIQKFLVRVMISYVKARMFDLGVKTVLSLLPQAPDEEDKPDEEEETEGEEDEDDKKKKKKKKRKRKKKKKSIFSRLKNLKMKDLKKAAAKTSQLALKVTKHFGYVPEFAKFGFCHTHVQIVNVCLHWFSNSLIFMTNLKNEAHDNEVIYEEIIAMEAGCPTMVFKNLQSVYDQVLELSKFIVTCNTEYQYATFTVPLHKMNLFGKSDEPKEEIQVNCQVVTQRLLKKLNYTEYDDIVTQYLEDFFDKFTKMNTKGGMRPKQVENARWIPLREKDGSSISTFGNMFVHDKKKDEKGEKQMYSFILVRHDDYKKGNDEEDCVWDQMATPKRLYLNHRKDVCELTNLLFTNNPKFNVEYPGIYQLLKGFDRAFQILRVYCENCVSKEEGVEMTAKHPFGTSGDTDVTEKSDKAGHFSGGESMLEDGENLYDIYLKNQAEEESEGVE